MKRQIWLAALLGVALVSVQARAIRAESIKIGLVKATLCAPLFIAQERGYFAAEGVPAEFQFFEAAQPIAVATVAGAIDFGIGAATAAFYNLAGQGQLRIIAGGIREAPSFHFFAYFASARAYQSGLKSVTDLPGHSVAITQTGSGQHYALGLLAEKYGFDLKRLRILPLQSIPNAMSAVTGGQADATLLSMLPTYPALVQKGDVKVLGWVGDETPWQFAIVFAGTKTIDGRADTVTRFLRAYAKGARDYHDAFTGAGEVRQDGPTASAVWAIIAKYVGLTADDVTLGVPYLDAGARVDVKDVLHQISWYKSQGMVKPEVDGAKIIDDRYVIPLAEK